MLRKTLLLTLFTAAAALTHGPVAQAALTWSWQYSGAGISAAGTFTTEDAPDADGFYQITGITGTRNGVAITELQPTGTAVPGNEPYAVDNLVRTTAPQLTVHGFGFSLTNGDYANPFHSESGSYEYLSVPPYENGAGPETPVSFTASIVPEPGSFPLVLAGLAGLLLVGAIRRRRSDIGAPAVPEYRFRGPLRDALDIVANFATFIGYNARFRRGVPAAGTLELGCRNTTCTRKLAVDWL